MTFYTCILFIIAAFYFGFFAESKFINDTGRKVAWAISILLILIPVLDLLYVVIRSRIV